MPNALELVAQQLEEEKKSGVIKTTKERIEEAYNKAKTAIEHRTDVFGDKAPPTPEELKKLLELKDKMLKEVEGVKSSFEKFKDSASDAAKKMLEKIGFEVTTERHQQFESARNRAKTKTDPGVDNGIADYEGYSLIPFRKPEYDGNYNNPTHWTLTGYLSAWERHDEKMADNEFTKAKNIYQTSDEEISTLLKPVVYKSFDYKHLKEAMKLGPYIDEMKAAHDFASESTGLLAGYMMIAETVYPQEKEAYKKYLLAEIGKLKTAGKLNYKSSEPETFLDINKGIFEVKALEVVASPKEFFEKFSPKKDRFIKLQNAGTALSTSLHFTYKDPVVTAFLGKKTDAFTEEDANNLDDVTNRMKVEALAALKDGMQKAKTKNGELNTEYKKLVEKSGDKLEEKELNDLHELLELNEKELGGINTNANITFEDLVAGGSKLESVQQRINIAENTIQNLQKKAEEDSNKKEKKEKSSRRSKRRRTSEHTSEQGDEDLRPLETLPDRYEQLWSQGVAVDSRFRKADLEVGPGLKETAIRSDAGKIMGYIPGLQDVTLVDVRAMGKKVDEIVFVNVFYRKDGKTVTGWVDEAALRYSDSQPVRPIIIEPATPKLEEDRAPLSRFKPKGPSPEIPAELGFLGNVYREYVDVLKQLDTYGKNREKYPDGVSFDLRINTDSVPCRVTYDPRGFLLTYGSKSRIYDRLENLMGDLNSGLLHQKITFENLTNKNFYTSFEQKTGSVSGIDVKSWKTAEMSLEWDGSNPEIHFEVLPHGRINYSVVRGNVGFYGNEVRSGIVDNGKDFMTLLAHDRKWAEGPKHERGENLASKKEILFSAIVNPDSYRNHTFENEAGRVIGFKLLPHEVVSMYLDWGGANDMNSKVNALFKVGVEKDGMLWFSIDNAALGPKGVGPERVKDFATMVQRVKEIRLQAFGGVRPPENNLSAEQSEVGRRDIDAFLREKNLVELNDGSNYYYVSNMQFSVVKGQPTFDYGNDVSSFERKAASILKGIFDKVVDQKDLLDIKLMAERAEKMNSREMRKAVLDAMHSFLVKISDRLSQSDIQKAHKVMDRMAQALYNSSLTFSTRPTIAELKRQYEEKAIPAWRDAERKLDELMR